MPAMLHFSKIHDYLSLDEAECRELGRSLGGRYRSADPFPHIVIDDFIDPAVLKAVLAEFPSGEEKEFFDRDQERFKFQFQPLEVSSGITRNLFAELNGQAFLGFLEELTGFEDWCPIPISSAAACMKRSVAAIWEFTPTSTSTAASSLNVKSTCSSISTRTGIRVLADSWSFGIVR